MARNTLVINCDLRETRVALIEDGVIAELQIERASARGTVGNIVLGKVTRVLPGMQAAFIDVGMERAAFLHVEDLIRPDDFEAYLTRGGEEARETELPGLEDVQQVETVAAASDEDDLELDDEESDEGDEETESDEDDDVDGEEDDELDEDDVDDEDEDEDFDGDEDHSDAEPEDEDEDEDDVEAQEDDEDFDSDSALIASAAPAEPAEEESIEAEAESAEARPVEAGPVKEARTPKPRAPSARRAAKAKSPSDAVSNESRVAPEDDFELGSEEDDDEENDEEEEEEEEEAEEWRNERAQNARARRGDGRGSRSAAAADPSLGSGGRRRRRRRRRGKGEDARPSETPSRKDRNESSSLRKEAGRGTRGRHSNNSRGRTHRGKSLRVTRSVPITEVVKEGDEVIVQISKEPIGTKGARVTSHVSLPGRYAVYLPTVEHVGISKRIGSSKERLRLKKVIEQMKPPKGGLIVRTVAEGLTKKALKTDVGYLIKLWADVSRKRENAKAPSVLYTELDLVLKTARDLFTDDIENIVIDDRDQYARLVRFVEMFMPERAKDIELYTGEEPIFDAYGIEDEIGRALSRKVPLPSGGYLIIDQAEALAAIDVNTGRYVGKGSKDLEETALKTNLEAVDEIAYQLRFRNIGGLVILDLIDMDDPSNRDKVWRALEQRLSKDKAKTTLNRISELGLIEMTRKRTRESLSRTMHEPCFYCDGTGQIQSRTTIAYEILRQIRRERQSLPGYSVIVNAHPAIVDLMTGEERAAVAEAERRYTRRIEFNPRREYHIEQFDLQGR